MTAIEIAAAPKITDKVEKFGKRSARVPPEAAPSADAPRNTLIRLPHTTTELPNQGARMRLPNISRAIKNAPEQKQIMISPANRYLPAFAGPAILFGTGKKIMNHTLGNFNGWPAPGCGFTNFCRQFLGS